MRTITLDQDSYQVPGSWDELSPKQLEFLARQLQKEVPVQQIKLYMVLHCLQAHVRQAPHHFGSTILHDLGLEPAIITLIIGRKRYRMDAEQFVLLAELMDYLVQPVEAEASPSGQPLRYVIAPELHIDPYPNLVIGGTEYKGSGNGLFSLRFEQYMYLQTYLSGMADQSAQLEEVLACVWCPDGQFDIEKIENSVKQLKTLTPERKLVMLWFVQSSLQHYSRLFPRLFSGDGPSSHRNVLDSQLRLLDSLAQHDVTKKDQVRKGWLMDAFYSLDEILKEQERMEERLKK